MPSEHEYAKRSLVELVKHVFNCDKGITGIFYSELAKRIGRTTKHGRGHGNGMGSVLEKMGKLLIKVQTEWGEDIPALQSLVVSKTGPTAGLPSNGLEEFWSDYSKLTIKEKNNKVRKEYKEIATFGSRWNQVLSALNLPTIHENKQENIVRNNTGESHQHLALKEFIRDNPHLVGAKEHDESVLEYTLPSLDSIDVLFKNSHRWIAVEVKSSVSDRLVSDYERGLYQCVKYNAILEAMKSDSQYTTPESIQVLLVLESTLPEKFKNLAKNLSITVLEEIRKPSFL